MFRGIGAPIMSQNDALARFREADRLFRVERYAEALYILDELDRVYPNTKNVMYPRACCLEKLGRTDEADVLCDALIAQYNLPRAVELKRQIAARGSVPADTMSTPISLSALETLDIDAPRPRTPAPQSSWDWSEYVRPGLIALGVVLVLGLLLALPRLSHRGAGTTSTSAISEAEDSSAQSSDHTPMISLDSDKAMLFYGRRLTKWGNFLVRFIATFVWYTINLLLTLFAVQKLQYDTWPKNIANCAAMAALCAAISTFLCFGTIINIFTLRQNYDLRVVDFLVLAGISIVTWLILFVLPLGFVAISLVQSGQLLR